MKDSIKTERNKMDKEIEKLIWMKKEFLKECRKMLDLIDKQELKINKKMKKKR